MRIYITRHGEAGNNVTDPMLDEQHERMDPRLTALGRRQAQCLGERLLELEPDRPPACFASPFWRTSETAQIIAEVLDGRFRAEAGLHEWFNEIWNLHHAFTGLNAAEASAAFDRLENPGELDGHWWSSSPELIEDCQRRVGRAIERRLPRLKAQGAEAVLFVGHGASADAALRHFVQGQEAPSCHKNCALSLVRLENGRARLEFQNCTRHHPV